jgi:hypothetical protein
MQLHLADAPTSQVNGAEREKRKRGGYRLVPPRSSARNVLSFGVR